MKRFAFTRRHLTVLEKPSPQNRPHEEQAESGRGATPLGVVLVTRHLDDGSGGFGRYEQWLLTELRRLCEVEPRAVEPWPIPKIATTAAKHLGLDLAAVLNGHPAHVPGPRDRRIYHLSNQHLAASFLWQRYQGPRIVTVHDIIPLVNPPVTVQSVELADRFLTWQWVQGLRRADLIIAVSRWTQADLVRHLGIATARIRVVYQAADTERLCSAGAEDASTLLDLGIHPGSRFLLYVGSLHPRKDVPTLVRALALARRDLPKLNLVLAGAHRIDSDTPTVRAIRDEIDQLGLNQAITVTGRISDVTLGCLYRQATATVLPSRAEGFGLPVLEAMACGCPVIGADATSLPEVIADAGLLFQPGDAEELAAAIIRIATLPELAMTLKTAGLSRAAEFSPQRRAAETVAVYREAQTRWQHSGRY